MRIICWNCNGLRTLRQYRPWYALKDWKECLDHLGGDMICFQEAKVTKKDLIAQGRDMCLPEGYEAYYSLHPTKGYSGVATFIKTSVCHVRKAEMGLTGELVPERADSDLCIGGYPDEKAIDFPLYDVIDAEGRAVVVDCGLFVLFNLYCPNETDESRREYKMTYSHTLGERVGNLIGMGREIVIVGDLNISHMPIDNCKNVNKVSREEHLDEHPARRWLDQFLAPKGDLFDVTRAHHPTRKYMYTCWDTVKDTRPANYGARIDYILVTKGLLKWVKSADIQADVYGSDHCPVYVDFHDEITEENGTKVKLRDFLLNDADVKRKVPALASCSWPEFSGRRLQSFFTAGAPSNRKYSASSAMVPLPKKVENVPQTKGQTFLPHPPTQQNIASSSSAPVTSGTHEDAAASAISTTLDSPKRKLSSNAVVSPAKRVAMPITKKGVTIKPTTAGQTNLKTFFRKPKQDRSIDDLQSETIAPSVQETSVPATPTHSGSTDEDDSMVGASRVESALAWGSIFAPKEPPKCSYHKEPAKAWTVNKAGPNHGRKFWMCARPVGADSETSNPGDYRCEFWKWDSDIRTKAKRQDRDADGSLRSFHEVAGRASPLGSGEKREPNEQERARRPPHKAVVRKPSR